VFGDPHAIRAMSPRKAASPQGAAMAEMGEMGGTAVCVSF
jgi:hypothetical protein